VHSISRKPWVFLLLSGVATGLSWLCYFRALQTGELSKLAPLAKLSVVMAMAFGALFLHQRLTAREEIEGFLIAAGALILAWKYAINDPGRRFVAKRVRFRRLRSKQMHDDRHRGKPAPKQDNHQKNPGDRPTLMR
jgi:hypothetical protein